MRSARDFARKGRAGQCVLPLTFGNTSAYDILPHDTAISRHHEGPIEAPSLKPLENITAIRHRGEEGRHQFLEPPSES